MTELDNNDATNISGISGLLSRDRVNRDYDLVEMEERLISIEGMQMRDQIDPAAEFKAIMSKVGTTSSDSEDESDEDDSDDDSAAPPPTRGRSAPPPPRQQAKDNKPVGWNMRKPAPTRQMPIPASGSGYIPDLPVHGANNEDYPSIYGNNDRSYHNDYRRDPYRNQGGNGYDPRGNGYDPRMQYPRQQRTDINESINQYQGEMAAPEEDEVDDMEERKADMIADIDELTQELVNMKRPVKNIPKLSEDSEYREVLSVFKMVRRRYDFARGFEFGQDVIVAMAQGLGWLFDGKRQFGPFRPYATNWHMGVRPKLRKMRFETSSAVSQVMGATGLGSGWRILLELVPSLIVYSNMHGADADADAPRYDPRELRDAYSDISDFDS